MKEKIEAFAKVLTNDPGPLDPWSQYYVANLHGDESNDVIQRMARHISRRSGGLYLFSGQRGTGKSTELRRLRHIIESSDPRVKVFIVDALEYINETHPIAINDLFLIVLLAFAGELRNAGVAAAMDQNVLARLTGWLSQEVSITSVAVGGAKVEFREQRESIVERLKRFSTEQQERFGSGCRSFISELAAQAKGALKCERVVLVVDSLERLRPSAGKEMFSRVAEIFESSIDKLQIDGLDMVYAVPPYLQYIAALRSFTHFFHLSSVQVFLKPCDDVVSRNVIGVSSMMRVIQKRFPEWEEVLSRNALELLIEASGGDLRQLLRVLLLDVVDGALFQGDGIPIQSGNILIERVVRRASREFRELLADDEMEVLRRVYDRKSVVLKNRDELTTIARFFDLRAIMNYHDGEYWVDVNPLLWEFVKEPKA